VGDRPDKVGELLFGTERDGELVLQKPFLAVGAVPVSEQIQWVVELPHIEQRTSLVRRLTAVVFAGGLARLVSWRATGRPHAVFIAAIVLELVGIPAVAVWQSRVARFAGNSLH